MALARSSDDLFTVDGKYLRLVTDLPANDSLQQFVDTFDAAVPMWLEYWNRDAGAVDGWRMTGYLMSSKSEFQKRGLIASSLPEFTNAYQSGDKFWVVTQPSDYYTLHLMLHEGAHGIAYRLFGGAGPPWYMEGTAEFLATHQRDIAGLRLGVIPLSKEASPYWGRIGLINDRRQAGKIPTIESVMRYGDTAHREVEPYAWSWMSALLMEMYPEYRERFRAAAPGGSDASPQFTRQFYQSLRTEWPVLSARWQLLCNDLEYGFDRERNRVSLDTSLPLLGSEPLTMQLHADQGWQSAPARVEAGKKVTIDAVGKYQLREQAAWESEADGVSISYHRGLPWGRVVACIVPEAASIGPYLPMLTILSIGSHGEFIVPQNGWLLVKVNDFPSSLGDNQGELELRFHAN